MNRRILTIVVVAIGVGLAQIAFAADWPTKPVRIISPASPGGASDTFARQHLDRDKALGEIDPDRLNVNGGAIALGHPVGATGARLVLTLLHEMRRRNLNLGIASLCVGGGQGAAILLERR